MMDLSMSSALLRGLSQDADLITQQLPYICTSGNCTYDAFSSLGICSACNNISSALVRSTMHDQTSQSSLAPAIDNSGTNPMFGNLTKYSLSDGNILYNGDLDHIGGESTGGIHQVAMTAKPKFDPTKTESFQKDSLLFFALSIIRADYTMLSDVQMSNWPNIPVTATECALSFCVKQINASVENGVLSEQVQKTSALRISKSWRPIRTVSFDLSNIFHFSSEDALNGGSTSSANETYGWVARSDLQILNEISPKQSFNISQVSIDSMQPGFLDLFPPDVSGTTLVSYKNVVALTGSTSAVKTSTSSMQVLWDSSNLTELFETIALSMTNELRRSSDNHTTIPGREEFSITVIRVNWPWMALPISLVLLGSIFVILTAWESHRLRQPIRKDEPPPIPFHGPDQNSKPPRSDLPKIREMSRTAEMTKVRFVNIDDKIGLGTFR